MNFYKRYMGDYGRGTGHLSLQDHGAYTLLLDHYYSTRLPLPADLDSIRRICKAITESETESVLRVANQFFPVNSDGLRHNKRCDEEISKWNDQAIVNREIGKLGGRPKKTESVTESITEHKPSPEVRSQKLEVRKHKPEKRKATPLPDDFKISERVKTWALQKGLEDLEADLEFFTGRMRANGKTYIDWDEAFMNCVREDWAKLRDKGPPKPDQMKLRCRSCGSENWGSLIDGRCRNCR